MMPAGTRHRARPRRLPMAHLRMPDHLGVCEVDGRIVMLDLRRDRYLELDPLTAPALRRWRDGDDAFDDDPGLARLIERGMLVPAAGCQPPRWTDATVRARSLLDRAGASSSRGWRHLPEVAATLWRARQRLRRNGLEAAVEAVRRRKPAGASADPLPCLLQFRAARMLVPLSPNCLVDSLALSAFLSRRGVRSDLVFGVKLDPFAAHCWLQDDRAVLNDGADSVAAFTPILVA